MTQQLINVGTGYNTGTGQPLRDAMVITNSNFSELYSLSATYSSEIASLSTSISLSASTINSLYTSTTFVASAISSTGNIFGTLVGNASTSSRWTSPMTLTYSGDATGSGSFTGATSTTITLSLSSVGNAGTYNQVVVDAKGRITSGTLSPISSSISVSAVNTAFSSATFTPSAITTSGTITITSGNIEFDNTVVGSTSDLSRHINLYENIFGLNITPSRMNLIVPSSCSIVNVINGTDVLAINSSGIDIISGNISFNNNVVSSTTDLSKHINLYGESVGINVTTGRMNLIAPVNASIVEIINGVDILTINGSGASLTGNLVVTGNIIGSLTATQWTSPMTLSYSGDVVGSGSFTGASPTTISITLASSGVIAGTYNQVVVNSKGIITSASYIEYSSIGTSVVSVNGLTGAVSITSVGYATTAGSTSSYTGTLSYSSLSGLPTIPTTTGQLTNDSGFIASGAQVITALGYTPYSSTNPIGFINANQNISISGDATGSGSTSIALTLNSLGSAGTYSSVVVNAKGLVVSGSSNISTNGTSLSLSGALTVSGTSALGPYNETLVSPSISSGTLTIDLSQGTVFNISMTGNITTLNFTNVPSTGRVASAILLLTSTGSAYSITWPSSVKWSGSVSPTLTSTNGKIDIISVFTPNAGTYWIANTVGQNY